MEWRRLCACANLFQKSMAGGLMGFEQPLFDRLSQVGSSHFPRATIVNITVVLDEGMLACQDNAGGFGLGPQGAHVDNERNSE